MTGEDAMGSRQPNGPGCASTGVIPAPDDSRLRARHVGLFNKVSPARRAAKAQLESIWRARIGVGGIPESEVVDRIRVAAGSSFAIWLRSSKLWTIQ